MSFSASIQNTIDRQHLLRKERRYIVALSGGADSVALFTVLRELGYKIVAAHCNFHLRGEESLRGENFCHTLCEKSAVRLHTVHFDTRNEAASHGESLEMAARRLRYEWFEHLRRKVGAGGVCVAHHRGDNVETLLLNLIRGTGVNGLTGMDYRRDHILRPLLGVSRTDIIAYLSNNGQNYVDDSSNTDTNIKRNCVRHELLPLMRRLNPSIETTITASMRRFRAARDAYEQIGAQVHQQALPLPHGAAYPIEALCHRAHFDTISRLYGFHEAAIDAIAAHSGNGKAPLYESPTHMATIYRNRLEVCRKAPVFLPQNISDNELQILSDGSKIQIKRIPREALTEIPIGTDAAAFGADAIQGTLVCRAPKAGDRFRPFGMKGTKLLNDYLADRRISAISRPWCRIITDEKGIIWVVGGRIDRRTAITDSTRRILLIHFQPAEQK